MQCMAVKIIKIDEKQCWMTKNCLIMQEIHVTETISSDRFMTGSKINARTVHVHTLLSAMDRLRVRLNVILMKE